MTTAKSNPGPGSRAQSVLPIRIEKVQKRSGQISAFDMEKIRQALMRAGAATGEFSYEEAGRLALRTTVSLCTMGTACPQVEEIQDVVEEVLLQSPHRKTARAYILYREQHKTPEGKAFTLETMDFLRRRLQQFQEETGNFYNLEATPAEGAAYRRALLDRKSEGDVHEDEVRVYTNSTQLPVNHTDDIFEVIEHQDAIQSKYTGGTVLHIFSGEENTRPDAIRRFVQKICYSCTMPYFTFTPTFSVCPEHGYHSGKHDNCPVCNDQCEVYSRVVGYLRPVNQWNDGKAAEFHRRSLYRMADSV
jgi:anaerobic ribonucleoside-triphosphate reductase